MDLQLQQLRGGVRGRRGDFHLHPLMTSGEAGAGAGGLFMGLIRRNDRESLNLMAKAAKIVPKACDILGISLSDTESEDDGDADDKDEKDEVSASESDNTAVPAKGRGSSPMTLSSLKGLGPKGHGHPSSPHALEEDSSKTLQDHQEVQDDDDNEARPKKPKEEQEMLTTTNTASGQNETNNSQLFTSRSRKRCASTPSDLTLMKGQSTMNSTGTFSPLQNPPISIKRRRRSPTISHSSGPGPVSTMTATMTSSANNEGANNLSPEEYAIRKQMLQDIETLHEQLRQLAEVEEQQCSLIRRYVEVEQQFMMDAEDAQRQDEEAYREEDNHQDLIDDNTTQLQLEEPSSELDEAVLLYTDAELAVGAEEVVVADVEAVADVDIADPEEVFV